MKFSISTIGIAPVNKLPDNEIALLYKNGTNGLSLSVNNPFGTAGNKSTPMRYKYTLKEDMDRQIYVNSVVPPNLFPHAGSGLNHDVHMVGGVWYPISTDGTRRSTTFNNSTLVLKSGNSLTNKDTWDGFSHRSHLRPAGSMDEAFELFKVIGRGTSIGGFRKYLQDGSYVVDATHPEAKYGVGFFIPTVEGPANVTTGTLINGVYHNLSLLPHVTGMAGALSSFAIWIKVVNGSVSVNAHKKLGIGSDTVTTDFVIDSSDGWVHFSGWNISQTGIPDFFKIKVSSGTKYKFALPYMSSSNILLRPWQHTHPIRNSRY